MITIPFGAPKGIFLRPVTKSLTAMPSYAILKSQKKTEGKTKLPSPLSEQTDYGGIDYEFLKR